MKIPDKKRCLRIISDMTMPDHILDHCRMVSSVATFLSQCLRPFFPEINIELATASALLHDITKFRSFSTGERHSHTGSILLADLGYPEVADIIRQHVVLDHYSDTSPVTVVEIVNYSDKRTLHDQVVPLTDRLAYIRDQYGGNPEISQRIASMWENTQALEKKIFRRLDFEPIDLKTRMDLCEK